MAGNDRYGITVLRDPASSAGIGEKDYPSEDVVFDLVAIHGLNGDAIGTWTHKETGVMWLKDLLPGILPNVRIMTYGYNARFKNFTAQQDLRSISSMLLAELVDLRTAEQERTRPIVLVCHSLGGIVAKKALLIGCSEEQEQIQRSVFGILFLGTPHNGSSLAVMGKLMANIVSACSPIRPPRALLGTLQKDSEILLEITEDFVKRRKKVQLVSFYELELTSIGPFFKRLIVEQQSAILNLPQEITIPQFADHRNIVRFRSPHDRCFRPVASRLKEFANELNHGSCAQTQFGLESARTIPLDVSTLPCSNFRGRDAVLEIMRTYFQGHHDRSQARRSFAICGLGGSGKTQTALHYIVQNMSEYKTGLAFLNATSVASLAADFEHLHDLLGLGESKNKIFSVKSWLSKPENCRWLLVFDNADNLDSVPILGYLPAVSWGHVIVTSRDQAVIGSIVEEGHVLDPLRTEDATLLLLERSGVQHPTQSETDEARSITKLLGSLPLALVQAGAFIRSRHRSLKEYHKLYLTRRNDLLSYVSRLGNTDKAVLTAWEINFRQVEEESRDAACLLLLFSFLEPSCIPEVLLHRGSSPQKRWGRNGEVSEIRAEDEGVDECLTTLIQNDFDFDTAVERLLSFSLISCNKDSNGLRNLSIHPLVQYCVAQRLSPSEINRWRWQALLLVCHSFPRNRYIEPLNGEIGRIILPHLSRVLSEYDTICIQHGEHHSFRCELASTLLAASRFSDAKWKAEAIGRTKRLLEDSNDPYLHAWLTYRESSIMRMSGMGQDSESVLQRFLQHATTPGEEELELTPTLNAQRGDLVISFSENLLRQGKLSEAKAELTEWRQLGTNYSTLERITSRARDITLGKVLRYQGLFKQAFELLERVLEESVLDDYFEGSGWYRVLLSGVAELHCELGQPVQAEKLLLQELTPMREKGIQDIATGRRLQISLAETYLQRNMYVEAESLLVALQQSFSSFGTPDYTAQVSIFRIRISLARMSHRQGHWEKALSLWRDALSVCEQLNLDEGFNAGLVRCSIAHAMIMTGHATEGVSSLQMARANMASEPRVFWIPLFNSQWHDFILENLREYL